MGSKKRSAQQKRVAEFKAGLAGADDLGGLFAREEQHRKQLSARKEEALREKACESKNRYATHDEANEAIRLCAEYGRTGLRAYRCKYCNGWHLTSHPQR